MYNFGFIGLGLIGFSDHAWDAGVPGCSEWYRPQGYERLEARRAELRKVRRNLLFLADGLRPRHPENDAHTFLAPVPDDLRHVDGRIKPPDIEFLAPPLVENDVFDAVLRGKVNISFVRGGGAVLDALSFPAVPPFPGDFSWPDPREVGILVRRRGQRVHDVRLGKLHGSVGYHERAPWIGARAVRLGNRHDLHLPLERRRPAVRDVLRRLERRLCGRLAPQ